MASRAWGKYIKNKEQKIQCGKCGSEYEVICERCGEVIVSKQHIISDFIIAGHAQEKAELLLTRDRGFYRNYFEGLKIESG